MIKIGIIREGKTPPDSRVPLTPGQCKALLKRYPSVTLSVQSSPHRCFSDQEYLNEGIEIVDDVGDCTVLFGVKEVPIAELLEHKTYLFFSHTIKKQPANRGLLQAVIRRKIKLVDYECLTDTKGLRVIAFGWWAGIVGAYNGLYAWGKRTGFELKRAHTFKDYQELKKECAKLKVPPVKIVITGDGRVAQGAVELMALFGIEKVEPEEYLARHTFNKPVYVQLSPDLLYQHKEGYPFRLKDFFEHPHEYTCNFQKFCRTSDIMINAIYWDPRAPRFFEKADMRKPDFRIKTIADISCDINGSVPATLRATTIADPVFGYNPILEAETAPYQDNVIDIMAIDNLPNELPRDASYSFGEQLMDQVIDELLNEDSEMIKRATIAEGGKLGGRFTYLQDYVAGNW